MIPAVILVTCCDLTLVSSFIASFLIKLIGARCPHAGLCPPPPPPPPGDQSLDPVLIIYTNNLNKTQSSLHITQLCIKVQGGNDQERMQSEKDSNSKNRGGKKLN